jgi:hypothetical protein
VAGDEKNKHKQKGRGDVDTAWNREGKEKVYASMEQCCFFGFAAAQTTPKGEGEAAFHQL